LVNPNRTPLIIGHRGASAVAPENTLAAFARAFRDGADGIELDVRLSRDHVPMVIHDASVGRGGERKRRIAYTSSEKLKQIDVGSWFNRQHREMARLEYTRQTIPTLDDVFRLVANQPNKELIVYVELKAGRIKKRNAELASAVIEVIARHKIQHTVVVISFNLWTIARIKQLDSSIRTGALFGQRQGRVTSIKRIITRAKRCGADEILLNHLIVTPRAINCSIKAGLAPVVWTVDDRAWIARSRQLGIHALMANNSHELLRSKA
jgi:glycerophosphoryl diester phosphodiesterase